MASEFEPAPSLIIKAQDSSESAFSPFGHIINIKIPTDVQSVGSAESRGASNPEVSNHYLNANNNTALKSKRPWELTNVYASAPSKSPNGAVINTFSCFPQQIQPYGPDTFMYTVDTFERHSYTSQTFIPITPPDADPHSKYLVIVSPNSHKETLQEDGHPDVNQANAFVLDRGQTVTYGVGTWHSPMVVLGPSRIDFVVMQHVNGVEEENCETKVLGGEGLKVVIRHELLEPKA